MSVLDVGMLNNQITIGAVTIDDFPVLQDFNKLWDKIEQDNNLVSGENYFNHIATWYGPVNYAYTRIEHKAQKMPVEFADVARDVENQLNYDEGYFNSLLINKFKNKGIGAHADDEPIFRCDDGTIGAVATISLGGPALITISRNNHTRHPYTFKVYNGSFYLMPEGTFQNEYKHSVSKSHLPRISLTFRHIPSGRCVSHLPRYRG